MEEVGMHPKVYEAAKSGDFENLMTILSGNGEDLFHQKTPKGNNILHVAALHKHVSLIQHLLRCPSRLSLLWQVNSKGDTPLHVAAKVGTRDVVQAFADLAKSLPSDVDNGQVDPCKELLRKQNLRKDTALHHAIRGGHDLVVELLIGEDPHLLDITNAADESPLYLAADRGLSRATELILAAFTTSSSHKGPKSLTALHAGISLSLTNWEKIMEKRLELIKEGDDIGWTPLHYVAYLGKVEAVRQLLQHDTSVAYKLDEAGESALHLAAFEGHVNVIDKLVGYCPDAFDILNSKGQTALHAAVIGGQVKVVKHIMGMPNLEDLIHEQDNNGNTALHLAAIHKYYRIICILARDKRFDRLAKNKDHLTAFDLFYAHKEAGLGAPTAHYLLKESHGFPGFQGWFIEKGKKRLDKQLVQDQPSPSVITESNTANRDNFDGSEKSIMDVQLFVAALVATVTFAATFTVPGGYNSDGPNRGLPILAGRPDFEAFLEYNSIAFSFSIVAILSIFLEFALKCRQDLKRILPAGALIAIAIAATAYACSMGMSIARSRHINAFDRFVLPYLAQGLPFFVGFGLVYINDHELRSRLQVGFPPRHVQKFLVESKKQLHNFLAWLYYVL